MIVASIISHQSQKFQHKNNVQLTRQHNIPENFWSKFNYCRMENMIYEWQRHKNPQVNNKESLSYKI